MRTFVNQCRHDCETRINVWFLRGNVTKIFEPRQAHMFNDEVEISKGSGCVVHVFYAESILVQRPNRRSLMHVDILNAEFLAFLKVPVCPRIGELPSLGITMPFRRVKLHSFPIVCFSVLLKRIQAILPIAWIPKAIRNDTIRMLLSECLIPFQI